MSLETDDLSSAKRRLIVHDALTFLSLTVVTVLLFAVTLFLFRSFAAHREDLGRRWSGRGQVALDAGHPEEAIVALRTALTYAPGEQSYELLLARALGEAGHTDEAYNYFLGLWETQPGNGLINLSLARLAVKKNDVRGAINYYRAAIYGTWEGGDIEHRRATRLELAQYLIAQHDNNGARAELLVAGANAPGDVGLTMELAGMLQQTGDSSDALSYYERVLKADPNNLTALEEAGRGQYGEGNFDEAHQLLEKAVRERADAKEGPEPADLTAMLEKTTQIMAMEPSRRLPGGERVGLIVAARALAKARFDACSAHIASASGMTAPLRTLSAAWAGDEASMSSAALMKDAAAQDAVLRLAYDTETQTSQICGAPSGGDALLLLLAKARAGLE
jgi:tetratricopeptide (TPR) repeat protein